MQGTEQIFYHIYNRGVEKRNIFQEENDYFRFIHDLYEFNDTNPANPNNRRIVGGRTSNNSNKRDLLVNIVCFCLMPNHFHLVLQAVKENGITQFMKKLGTGYAMYFNEKYDRVGSLFQGRFKSVLIENDEQFMHLSRYIHLNPIEIVEPSWKENDVIQDWPKAKKFLENYRYSSYLDYIGTKNFPSVIYKNPLLEYFKTPEEYKEFTEDSLVEDIDYSISELTIDQQ